MNETKPSFQVGHYAKLVVAAIGAAAIAATAAFSGGITADEGVTVVIAALSALGVLSVPNARVSD